jgi:hypothetical protein
MLVVHCHGALGGLYGICGPENDRCIRLPAEEHFYSAAERRSRGAGMFEVEN